MKILLPVDLVHPIEPTIDLMTALCDLSQHSVHLLYVRELLPAYESVIKTSGSFVDDWEKKLEAKAREHLSDFLQKLKPHCQSVSIEVASGTVAATIAAVAADEGHDLIVVAPGQHPLAERLLSGSVTGRLLDHSPCPILVGRPSSNATDRLANVLIGYDGSENARVAIEGAAKMFRVAGAQAKVTVVHSVDVAEPVKFLSPVEFVASIEQNLLMVGETYLATAEKILYDNNIKKVDCCLIEGDPATGLLKMAADISADLIVLGAHGHGSVADFLLGSVSHKVAMNAHCSVAVIKRQPG